MPKGGTGGAVASGALRGGWGRGGGLPVSAGYRRSDGCTGCQPPQAVGGWSGLPPGFLWVCLGVRVCACVCVCVQSGSSRVAGSTATVRVWQRRMRGATHHSPHLRTKAPGDFGGVQGGGRMTAGVAIPSHCKTEPPRACVLIGRWPGVASQGGCLLGGAGHPPERVLVGPGGARTDPPLGPQWAQGSVRMNEWRGGWMT